MKLVSEEDIFLFFHQSQAYFSYAVFVCCFENSLLPRRPEPVSSTLLVVVKLRFLAFICGSEFFSFPPHFPFRSAEGAPPVCLDVGRQPGSIEKLPAGKL